MAKGKQLVWDPLQGWTELKELVHAGKKNTQQDPSRPPTSQRSAAEQRGLSLNMEAPSSRDILNTGEVMS